MKKLTHISPSMYNLYTSNKREFYLKYLAEFPPSKIPQTQPMSVGSAFDAYVKSYITKKLFGTNGKDLDELLVTQVEAHNLDWAREHGKIVFERYRDCGALADLMLLLMEAVDKPRFEFRLQNDVKYSRTVGGIGNAGAADVKNGRIRVDTLPFVGYPDCSFTTKQGMIIVLDWKVNGYCGASPTSPKKNYIKLREPDGKIKRHKDVMAMTIGGVEINVASCLSDSDVSWAQQLSVYGWLLGLPVGTPFIGMIDQIVRGSNGLRVSSIRAKVGAKFQTDLFEDFVEMFEYANSGVMYDAELDDYYKAFEGETEDDEWFRQNCR